jgi:serine/threonine protein kinase
VNWLSDRAIGHLRAVANWPEFKTPRYTVLEEIGRGGMGTVYLATDNELGREVAIKVSNHVATSPLIEAGGAPTGPADAASSARPGGSREARRRAARKQAAPDTPDLPDQALERRLRTEARILARLEHPGIVPIHDVGRLADGRLFYVMKHIRGDTLAEHLRRVPDLAERLRIFERICEPVAFAHSHGFIHRDLKPDNVMIGAFGEVMVMDWGVAKVLGDRDVPGDAADTPAGDHTGPGTILGTKGFMAPEQARGAAEEADERADVYGLGALLFMLLTGAPPAGLERPGVPLFSGHREIPRALKAICVRALASDPRDRYPTVRALSDDVRSYRAGRAVDAHQETVLERIWRVAWTYRTPILLVLAYMIMRAAVAFWAGW